MQDIHPVGGGGERFYGGGGDRRLRQNNHQNHQALKCPRCDSINTKFCYYNNYNLSQPRHFCKSCRRYWTKGGVLRNVPVGGGCRKSKRSKPKPSPSEAAEAPEEQKSDTNSSSESSSLTATTTAAATAAVASASAAVNTSGGATTEDVSATSSNSASTYLNFPESNFFISHSTTNQSFDDHPLMENSAEVQFQDMGNFSSMMTSSNDPSMIGFNMAAEIPAYRLPENQNSNEQWNQQSSKLVGTLPTDELKLEQMSTDYLNHQSGRVEFPGLQQSRINNSELASLDWQNGTGGGGNDGDHGLYDLTGTVDQSYWSQTHWGDNDNSLNFLP